MHDTPYNQCDIVTDALKNYADMVRRICFIYLRNQADVEDIFQEVFLKLLIRKDGFESEEHKKAFLCRVAINKCKDLCRSFFRKNVCSIDDVEIPYDDKTDSDVMQAV